MTTIPISRDAGETIESLHHLAATWRESGMTAERFLGEVVEPTLADVSAEVRAKRKAQP